MEQNKYHEAMDKIVTPPALKEKTRRMLLGQTAKQKSYTQIWRYSALAAAIALLAGFGIWFQVRISRNVSEPDASENAGYASGGQTELIRGEHKEIVILRDGELHFTPLTNGDLESPIKLSPSYPLRRNMSLEEYPDALPVDVPSGLSPPEGGVTAYFSDPSQPPAAIVGKATYLPQTGGLVTLTFTDEPSLLYKPIDIGGSEIAGVTVGVGYLETEDVYYSTYLKNGYTVLLTAEGAEQSEFISLLRDFLK